MSTSSSLLVPANQIRNVLTVCQKLQLLFPGSLLVTVQVPSQESVYPVAGRSQDVNCFGRLHYTAKLMPLMQHIVQEPLKVAEVVAVSVNAHRPHWKTKKDILSQASPLTVCLSTTRMNKPSLSTLRRYTRCSAVPLYSSRYTKVACACP